MRILYVTHYGIMEPLGQSQILPYLLGLSHRGHSFDILSFEKPHHLSDPERVVKQKTRLSQAGISWYPRPYRRGHSLVHLASDVVGSAGEIRRRVSRARFDLIHCRTHVPYLMSWAGAMLHRTPVLFDFRGFLAEEYVDSGMWRSGCFKFRATKALERMMARSCSALVVLTDPARDYLTATYAVNPRKVFVIPCCVDLDRFKPDLGNRVIEPKGPLKVVYAGSTIGRYHVDGMLRFFELIRSARPGSRFTILSSGDPSTALDQIARAAASRAVEAFTVSPDRVPEYLAKQDLGLIFMRGGLGLLATSPAKLGEYLACGLVVVAEAGIGGIREILMDHGVGCLIDSRQNEAWSECVEAALRLCDLPGIREKAVEVASKLFSLQDGINRYEEAYRHAAAATGRRERHPR